MARDVESENLNEIDIVNSGRFTFESDSVFIREEIMNSFLNMKLSLFTEHSKHEKHLRVVDDK